MDTNDHDHTPGHDAPYSWIRHASWNPVPIDQLPTATGPIVYEGFVPQQVSTRISGAADQEFRNGPAATLSYSGSQYPPIDHYAVENQFDRAPVQLYDQVRVSQLQNRQFTPALEPQSRTTQHNYPDLDINEALTNRDGNVGPLQTIAEGEVSNAITTNRGRGRGRGRGRPRGRGSNQRRRGEGSRGGWNKGTRTGLRPVLDPGEEFNALHTEASTAFLVKNFDEALELVLKAISINPEINSAHVLLSEIYFAKGDAERGMAALFSGAHASPNDPDVWQQLADKCLQQATMDRLTMLKQASYCFQRLLQINQHDHDARFQKAAISRELGHHAKAFKDLDYLLQEMPHNPSILRQYSEVCIDINDVGRAIGLYDSALEYYMLGGSSNEEALTWHDLIVYVDLMARANGPYCGIQILKRLARWLVGRQEETFWEDIMQDDREWDDEHAPRRSAIPQFDPNQYDSRIYGKSLDMEWRIKLGDLRLKSGDRQEALSHFARLCPEERDEDAPLYNHADLFLQVADVLREIKEFRQALQYYEALDSIDACDDLDFWLGFGACSYICEKKEQALFCYERAKDIDPTSGDARTQLSKLYAEKGERETALLLARSAITIYENQLPKTDRRKYERKDLREAREAAQSAYKEAYKIPKPRTEGEELPKPYFSRRALERARRLAKAATQKAIREAETVENNEQAHSEIREGSLTPPSRPDGLRAREEAQRQTRQKRKPQRTKSATARHNNVQQLFSTLCGVTHAMRGFDDVSRNIWMDCAEALVTEFRRERAFYPGDRYLKFKGYHRQRGGARTAEDNDHEQPPEDIPLPSVESSVPHEYLGIAFPSWLDIFLEYAMLLANLQEDSEECYTVLRAAIDCNVWFHDPEALIQIHTCWLACALALRDEVTLFNTVIRWFMREFLFCTDTFRLFGALNFYFPHANDKAGKIGQMNNAVFRSGPNQKYLFRQIMAVDSLLPEGYGSDQPDGPVPEFMRKVPGATLYMSDQLQQQNEMAQLYTRIETDDNEDDLTPPRFLDEQGSRHSHRTFTPNELDVVLLTLYAQILYAGSSFPNALSYFYRAYNLEPKNPVILLSIALSYMHQMLKRQNENRHMYLLQGWSFFEEYVEARTEWAERKEKEGWAGLVTVIKREIEFNRARCWQMLGMSDLALRGYRKMLDLKPVKNEDEMDTEVGDECGETCTMEAAYAIATMYATNGDMDEARRITEQYLVV